MCACALQVRPESVKFVLKWSYAAHLTLLCLVDDAFTRLWVLGSTMLTCAACIAPGAVGSHLEA